MGEQPEYIRQGKTAFTNRDDILKDAISTGLNPKQKSLKIRIEQASDKEQSIHYPLMNRC